MKALYFDSQLSYKTDYPIPKYGTDDVLIRITRAGICNTDIEITRGYMGFRGIPGHEFVGIVEKCNNRDLVGKRVTGEINIGCGKCPLCRNNMGNHCPDRSVLGILNKDGAFAEYITLPKKNIHLIPDGVSDDEAIFTEPVAAAFEILEQVPVGKASRVCVLGDGKLGLLTAQVINTTGCSLTVIGKHQEKLQILKERSISTILSSEKCESGYDLVVDCTGSASGIEKALGIVRPRGTIVMKTTVADRGRIDMNNLVINEITLIGSRCGPFIPAIGAIKNKKVDVIPLISHRFPLDKGRDAFDCASEKGALKVVLDID